MQLTEWHVSNFSIVNAVWLFFCLAFFISLNIHVFIKGHTNSILHILFQDFIRYGKTKKDLQRPKRLYSFDVPKRWFSHFYVISVIWNGMLLWLLLHVVFSGEQFPRWLQTVLYVLCQHAPMDKSGDEVSVVLMLVLLLLQSIHRLIECLFISVFSNGVIHLVQYCFGVCYYILLGLTILCQKTFTENKAYSLSDLYEQVGWNHIMGSAIFLWGFCHQYRCHAILANLRKNKSGEVVTWSHSIPYGDWFEHVSCPNYLAELVIYLGMGLVFGGLNFTWWLVVMYVLFSHALEAVLCHEFYVKKFESYPKHRKAFIPLIF
uniref:Polyprenal reductase n=1 Tax=Protopterus annectens TaxID=7888 RepID=A0A2U9NKS8_PROAN|nr:SRD5A3 [Protopterus annectens]